MTTAAQEDTPRTDELWSRDFNDVGMRCLAVYTLCLDIEGENIRLRAELAQLKEDQKSDAEKIVAFMMEQIDYKQKYEALRKGELVMVKKRE